MGIGDERTLELAGEKAAEEVEAGRGVFAVEDASRRHSVTSRRHAATSRRRFVASSASRSRVRGRGGRTGCRRRRRRGTACAALPHRRLPPSAAAASSQLALGLWTR
jgi:hypothetical protein